MTGEAMAAGNSMLVRKDKIIQTLRLSLRIVDDTRVPFGLRFLNSPAARCNVVLSRRYSPLFLSQRFESYNSRCLL